MQCVPWPADLDPFNAPSRHVQKTFPSIPGQDTHLKVATIFSLWDDWQNNDQNWDNDKVTLGQYLPWRRWS